MLGLHVEAVDVVEPAVPGFGNNGQRPPVAGGIGLAVRDAPLDDRVAHHADAVRVGDHHRAFEEAGFFYPGGAGHFAIAVERPPAGKNRITHGILAARENRGDPGANGAFADLEFSLASNERGVADGDAGDVCDGIQRAWRSVERYAEITRAGFRGWLVLWICGSDKKGETDHSNDAPQ